MGWKARASHVSQLFRHGGDAPGVIEGGNDCFEASLARYLREQGWPWADDDASLVAELRLRVTGAPDRAGQGYTSLAQAVAGMAALGIAFSWTSALLDAQRQPWAIYWVRASRLRLEKSVAVAGFDRWTAWPPSWWTSGADPDHFILKLPDGSFNDPLAWYTGDCRYSQTSLAAAFGGAWILYGVSQGPQSGKAGGNGLYVVTSPDGVHLREAPELDARILATIEAGARVEERYEADCLWRFVRAWVRAGDGASEQHGWVRRDLVQKEG